ncbi:hypothetical protein CRG98_034419 [Punica granatum]|uniref:Uncharacterized protein n=1 Tax=Punica granatum TaxID=22663 RepID=A0A2I0IMF6_PUNGR|nr:hypothetical protein CRG98_034419 [Punica granatum]
MEVLRIQDEKAWDECSELNEDEGFELNDTDNDMTYDVDVTSEEGDWDVGDGGDESNGFQSIDSGDEGGSASRLPEFRQEKDLQDPKFVIENLAKDLNIDDSSSWTFMGDKENV